MPLRISGKNIAIGAALRDRIGERIGEAAGKYFKGGYSGHVTVGRDGYGFHTECVLHLDSGVQRFGAHRFYLASRMDIIAHHFSMKFR